MRILQEFREQSDLLFEVFVGFSTSGSEATFHAARRSEKNFRKQNSAIYLRERGTALTTYGWMLFIVVSCLGGRVYCQLQNGNIIGSIIDPNGALVHNVKVTATDELTKVERAVATASDGTYLFQLLPAGSYTVRVELSGFKKHTNSGVTVDVGKSTRADIQLVLGEVTAAINVTGESAVIQTEAADISTVRESVYFTRNPRSQTSIVNFGQPTVSKAGGYFGYNGSKQTDATVTQDGVEFSTYRNYVLAYSVDEVKVEHTDSPAQYQTAVNINLVMKRGSNDLHGRAEFSLFNLALNAISNPRVHTRPPGLPYWEAGISVNGPVFIPKAYDGRNRTFWMFTYTPQKNSKRIQPVTQTQPPLAWRTGNLSSFSGQLRNPFTNQPFAGNIIPPELISPVAKNLNSYLGTPTLGATQVESTVEYLNFIQTTKSYRVDHKIKNNLEFSSSFTRFVPSYTAEFTDRSIKGWGGIADFTFKGSVYALGLTHTISPNLVNEIRGGLSHEDRVGFIADKTIDVAARLQKIGLTGINPPSANLPATGPNINITGFTPFAGSGSDPNQVYHWHISDNLSLHKGKHNVQLGFEYKRRAFNRISVQPNAWAEINFTGRFTGQPYADFLLGLPGTVSRQNVRPLEAPRNNEYGAFLQDSFRVTPTLTLNYGIRYDYISPEADERDLMFSFDKNTNQIVVPNAEALRYIDPFWPLQRNPVVTASVAGLPQQLAQKDFNNLYPRFGFAWRPFNNGKMVVRGGYGIYVVPDFGTGASFGMQLISLTGPFALNTVYNNVNLTDPSQGAVPFFTWPVGIPGPEIATTPPLPSITFVNPDYVFPYTQQANLSLEREVRGQRLRLSYIMQKHTKLFYPRDINLPPASTTPFTDARLLRPNFRRITEVDNGGGATYHAGEAVLYLKRAFGFSGETGFAWSKQLSDIPEGEFDFIQGNPTLDPYCRRCDRGESSYVRPFRWVTYLYWDVPYGKGKRYGSCTSGPLNQILGGWEISTEIQIYGSNGITPAYTGADPSGLGITSGRPDLVGGWKSWELPSGQRSADNYFNAAAFAVPANNVGRFGNAGRSIIRGPGYIDTALGLFKTFPINEKMRVVFSSQITNPLNHPSFGYVPYRPTNPINSPTAALLPVNLAAGRTIHFNLAFEF